MKKFIYSAVIMGLVLGLSLCPLRGADTARAELNTHISEINRAAKSGNKMPTALHAVAIETGVPLERVEAMHKRYPDEGPAGVLMASVLADETKKSPEEFLNRHHSGQIWTKIVQANHVSLDKFHERLDHVDRALNSASDKPEKRKK